MPIDAISKVFTMRGKIRTKEKCPKCTMIFKETTQGIICPDCLTKPKKYFIDLYEKNSEKKRIKIYSDQNGYPLDSFQRAYRVLEHIRHEIDNHKFDPSKYIKCHLEQFYFSTKIEKWVDRKQKHADIKKSLANSYIRILKSYKDNYFLNFFGNMDVREIRTVHVKEFYEGLPMHLSPKTQSNIITALQNFFNELHEDEIIENMPSFKKILDSIDVKKQEIKWFDYREQQKVLAFIGQISYHRPIVEFMCETGIRPSEAMAIYWEDFDLKESVLHIRKTFSDRKLKDTTKSGRNTDIIPLSDRAVEILKSISRGINTFIFTNPNSKGHYNLDTLDRLWDKVRIHFNINKKVKLYNFTRHSFATQIASSGATPIEIKELLRHSDIRTSMKYVQKDLKPLRACLRKRAEVVEFKKLGNA